MSYFYQVFLFYSVIKHCVPPTSTCSQSCYNRNKLLTVIINTIHIFGVITVDFPSNASYWRKKRFPNYALWRYFYLAAVVQSLKISQYVFYVILSMKSQTKFSSSPSKSNTNFPFIIFIYYHPQKFPNMNVAKIDTFLNVDNKIMDIETHNIHEQAYWHNNKWNNCFSPPQY